MVGQADDLAGNGLALFFANMRLITAAGDEGRVIMTWLIAGAATLIIALGGAVACALLWYLAETRIVAIEADEAVLATST